MKFIGYNEWTHRGLYTSFQSNLNFYMKAGIFSLAGIDDSYGLICI